MIIMMITMIMIIMNSMMMIIIKTPIFFITADKNELVGTTNQQVKGTLLENDVIFEGNHF
jgi:hypothetical protein